jgi:hypothetical protein
MWAPGGPRNPYADDDDDDDDVNLTSDLAA